MTRPESFDDKFQEIFTKMIEISFEYVNKNSKEVDEVHVFGSIESGYFFNVFYRINGILVEPHQINTISQMQYDITEERIIKLLRSGNIYLHEMENLFKVYNREVPTIIKMSYMSKTGEFTCNIEYGLKFTNHQTKMPEDIYNEWFDELNK